MKSLHFFKKVAKLNSKNQPNLNNDNESKKISKKKKIIFSTLGVGSLVAIIGVGIGVPISVASQQGQDANLRKLSDVAVVLKSKNGSNDITVGQLLKNFESNPSKEKEDFQEAKKTLIKYLYNQEYEASKLFQKAWDSSNTDKTQNNSRKFELQSYDEIRDSQKKVLEDERARYQKTYGFNNWESEFNKHLNTDPRFGNATTFDQAVDNLTISKATDIAFARFKLNFDTSFTRDDIENRIVGADIVDKNNKVVFAKGQKLFKDILVFGENAIAPSIVSPNNGAVAKDQDKNQKVAAFLTKSFIKKYMNPKTIIDEIYSDANAPLKNNFYFYDISQLTLNAKPDSKDANAPWTVDKKTLEFLLSYRPLSENQSDNASNVENNLELIQQFKGGLSDDVNQNLNDRILLSTLDYSDNKKNAKSLGRVGLESREELFNKNDASYFLSFLKSFQPKESSKILSQTLFENLKKSIFKDHESLLPDPSSLAGKSLDEIKQINFKLKQFIEGLSDNDLKEVGKAFRDTFGVSDTDGRVQTSYKINDNLKLVLNSNGLNAVAFKTITNYSDFYAIIKKQLQLKANNLIDSNIDSTLDLNSIFSTMTDNDFIQALVMQDPDYVKILTDNSASNIQKNPNFIQSVKQTAKNYLNSYLIKQVLKINQKIQDYILQVTNNNLNSDYKYDMAKEQWELSSTPGVELRDQILKDLETTFGIGTGRK